MPTYSDFKTFPDKYTKQLRFLSRKNCALMKQLEIRSLLESVVSHKFINLSFIPIKGSIIRE